MTVTIFFQIQSTASQYDAVIRDLERAGAGAPAGRIFHAAQPDGDRWSVVDVWASAAAFEAFAPVLVPILVKNGITPPEPKVLPTHHVIRGA